MARKQKPPCTAGEAVFKRLAAAFKGVDDAESLHALASLTGCIIAYAAGSPGEEKALLLSFGEQVGRSIRQQQEWIRRDRLSGGLASAEPASTEAH